MLSKGCRSLFNPDTAGTAHPHKQSRYAQDAQARPAGRATGLRNTAGMGKNGRPGGVLGIARHLNDVRHSAGNAQCLPQRRWGQASLHLIFVYPDGQVHPVVPEQHRRRAASGPCQSICPLSAGFYIL